MTAWLLTWLWQGLALTLVLSGAFRVLPRLNAATRYAITWAVLGALGAMGAMGATGASGAAGAHLTHPSHPTHLVLVPAAPDVLVVIVVGVWIGMALVSLVRILPSIHAVFRLRDQCVGFPPEVEAQLPLWREARQRRGARRATKLMLCDGVAGATVLGFHRPCIAVPSSLVNALTRDELDQVVLHEDAHLQRWDDWTRLAQALLESVLWVHPATAIIGRRLNLEREIACDEWVVATTGLPKVYARCLTRAAEVRNRLRIQLLFGPALFTRRRDLVLRVNRLLTVKGRTQRNVSKVGALAGLCTVAVLTLQLRAIPLVGEAAPIARAATAPSHTAARATSERRVMFEPPVTISSAANPGTAEPPNRRTFEPPNRRTFEPPNLRTHEPTNRRTPEPTNSRTPEPADPVETEPMFLSARSFDGRYAATESPAATPDRPARWQMAGEVGMGIGTSARKASVGMANAFTRAGVSLARRF